MAKRSAETGRTAEGERIIQSPCGCMLTLEEARSIAGKARVAMRRTAPPGRARGLGVTCECGTCPKCRHREYMRARRDAGRG